jgi:hypothetical protein
MSVHLKHYKKVFMPIHVSAFSFISLIVQMRLKTTTTAYEAIKHTLEEFNTAYKNEIRLVSDPNLYCIVPNSGDTSSMSTNEDGPLQGLSMGVSLNPNQNLFETGSTDFKMRLFLYSDVESELNAVILAKKPFTPSDTSSLSSAASGSPASG